MTKGDPIWFRRAGNGGHIAHPRIPGIFMYQTPRRCAIEIRLPDGTARIVFADPANLEPREEDTTP